MSQCSQLLARTLSLCGAVLQAGCDVVWSAPLLVQVWSLGATPPAYSVDTCVAKTGLSRRAGVLEEVIMLSCALTTGQDDIVWMSSQMASVSTAA